MTEKIICQAAEALIIKEGGKVIKRRIKKSYRISELDEKLRKFRTRGETKLLEKADKLISVPKLIKTDEKNKEITMQFIEGKKLSETLDNLDNKYEVMQEIGEQTAKLHDNNIIHGDLTTSNMIYAENENAKLLKKTDSFDKADININKERELDISKSKNITQNKRARGACGEANLTKLSECEADSTGFKIFFIDFGLGYHSLRIEDKAVDLHLIKQALEAKHFQNWKELFQAFLKGYNSKDKARILIQLEKVEARGRYRKNAH